MKKLLLLSVLAAAMLGTGFVGCVSVEDEEPDDVSRTTTTRSTTLRTY